MSHTLYLDQSIPTHGNTQKNDFLLLVTVAPTPYNQYLSRGDSIDRKGVRTGQETERGTKTETTGLM